MGLHYLSIMLQDIALEVHMIEMYGAKSRRCCNSLVVQIKVCKKNP